MSIAPTDRSPLFNAPIVPMRTPKEANQKQNAQIVRREAEQSTEDFYAVVAGAVAGLFTMIVLAQSSNNR